jgi:hypothetical protein
MLFVLALPILFNTEHMLGIWLKEVPAHTVLFVQLYLIFALSESLSTPLITAMLATGRIKYYQIAVGGLQLLNLPLSYLCLKLGALPEVTVGVAIVISQVCLLVRVIMLSRSTGFPKMKFFKEVYLKTIFMIVPLVIWVPLILELYKPAGLSGLLLSCGVCVMWTLAMIYFIGLSTDERMMIKGFIKKK